MSCGRGPTTWGVDSHTAVAPRAQTSRTQCAKDSSGRSIGQDPERRRPITPSRSAWIRDPVWDGIWMLNALWLVPLVVWLAWGRADPESSSLDVLYFGLTALFWIGHRVCSTWLAYCTEAFRPLLRTQPVRFVVLP